MKSLYSGLATIFMLHRVAPSVPTGLTPNEMLKVNPVFLERTIISLQRQGYTFISLDELYTRLINRQKVKKGIVFTLDDGYKDNYEIAYPIFKKYNIPFTIYVTTAFPEKNALLWWYGLEEILLNHDFVVLSDGSKFHTTTYEEKNQAFMDIRKQILQISAMELEERIRGLFDAYSIDWSLYGTQLTLDWSQIEALSKDPLVTIGNHTMHHYALTQLLEEDIVSEINGATRLLENHIGIPIKHFAYPFGSDEEAKQREVDIVNSLGFDTATTTRQGNVFVLHRSFLSCLPRVMLTNTFDLKALHSFRRKRFLTI